DMRILSTHVVTLGIALEKTQNVSSKCVQGSGQWWAIFNADWYKNLPNQKVKVLAEDNKTVETDNVRLVFLNSLTNEPHSDVSNYRSRFFMSHLAKAGIRVRPPKQARHTFASQLLTKGVNIKWIANQMGHKSIKMIEEHYGKYMPNEMPDMAMQVSNMLGYDSKRSNADPRFEEIELNPLD
ncbi:tyrosine-type recombinase/integrase, partial [Thalassotalea fusca]